MANIWGWVYSYMHRQNYSCLKFPRGKTLFPELITSHIHSWDKQVTHAHILGYEAADEEDQNRNQSWAMNICAGHKALLNQFSVPDRFSLKRQIGEPFDHCLSVKSKTLFSLRYGGGKWQDCGVCKYISRWHNSPILESSLNDECLCLYTWMCVCTLT